MFNDNGQLTIVAGPTHHSNIVRIKHSFFWYKMTADLLICNVRHLLVESLFKEMVKQS